MRKIDFKKLKIGDTVYSIRKGEGKVTGLNKSSDYSIEVYFKNAYINYTKDGKFYDTDLYPEIYLDPISFGFEERVMEVSNDGAVWFKRVVFAYKRGKHISWNSSETIEEAKDVPYTTAWELAREIQEEKSNFRVNR